MPLTGEHLTLERTWRHWPAIAAAAAGGALAFAHILERLANLPPCQLCFTQRWVYWAAIAVGAVGFAAVAKRRTPAGLQTVDVVLAGVFLTGAVVASYHAGVEWRIFPDPGCGVGERVLSVAELQVSMTQEHRVISCSEAPFRVLGLSMAGWNALLSLGLAALSLWAAARVANTWDDVHAA